MITEEVNLFRASQKRKRFLAIASAVALVGVFCFALVMWRFSTRSPPAQVTAAEAPPFASHVVQKKAASPEPAPPPERAPTPVPGAPVRIEPEPEAAIEHAYLTLTSNVRARVYLNGKAVRGYTPLRRHRVSPGTHKIAVVAVRTGERREFTHRFEPGKTVTLTERFKERRR